MRRKDDAVATFRKLIGLDPKYVPAYHQMGLTLRDAGHPDEAKTAFREGIAMAEQVGNGHAAGEIASAVRLRSACVLRKAATTGPAVGTPKSYPILGWSSI